MRKFSYNHSEIKVYHRKDRKGAYNNKIVHNGYEIANSRGRKIFSIDDAFDSIWREIFYKEGWFNINGHTIRSTFIDNGKDMPPTRVIYVDNKVLYWDGFNNEYTDIKVRYLRPTNNDYDRFRDFIERYVKIWENMA